MSAYPILPSDFCRCLHIRAAHKTNGCGECAFCECACFDLKPAEPESADKYSNHKPMHEPLTETEMIVVRYFRHLEPAVEKAQGYLIMAIIHSQWQDTRKFFNEWPELTIAAKSWVFGNLEDRAKEQGY